jgi:hypothetical protein
MPLCWYRNIQRNGISFWIYTERRRAPTYFILIYFFGFRLELLHCASRTCIYLLNSPTILASESSTTYSLINSAHRYTVHTWIIIVSMNQEPYRCLLALRCCDLLSVTQESSSWLTEHLPWAGMGMTQGHHPHYIAWICICEGIWKVKLIRCLLNAIFNFFYQSS